MDKIKEEVSVALNDVAKVVENELFRKKSIDVGNILFIIHRKKNAYGYCSSLYKWNINGEDVREIGITPEGLSRPLPAIITTIAHELVHASNAIEGINDCNGRKHNNMFKERCDVVGIPTWRDKKNGWVTPYELWDPAVMNDIISKLQPNTSSVLGALFEKKYGVNSEEGKKKDKNLKVFICPRCGVKARAKPSANLICGDCMVLMDGGEKK